MLLLYVFHKWIARCYSKDNKKQGIQKSRKYSAQKYPTGIPGCPENMGELKKGAWLMKKILAKVNEFFKEYYESFAEEPVL